MGKTTVDGRNPAPVDWKFIPLFTRFFTFQVVQDFFHQQYVRNVSKTRLNVAFLGSRPTFSKSQLDIEMRGSSRHLAPPKLTYAGTENAANLESETFGASKKTSPAYSG